MISKGLFLVVSLFLGLFFILTSREAGALEGLQVGMKAPLISLQSLEGEMVSFPGFPRAKLFVVVFWSTWSEYSADELERLEKLYKKYKDLGLVVLGVNVESQNFSVEEIGSIKEMVRNLGLTFPVVLDKGLEIFHSYGVMAIPSTVVIDKELVIKGEMAAYPIVGREELFEFIEALVTGREITKKIQKTGYEPVPRAVRYYNLSRAMGARGLVDQTDANLRKSIESDPRFILPLILLGKIYKERALTEEAIEYKGKTYTTATFSRERDQYLQEAADLLKKALELDPKSASSLTELASIFLLKGQINEAEEMLRRALEADPSYTPAHYSLGSVLYKKGDLKGGQKEFEVAQKLNPLDPKVYHTMAQAYEEKGMVKQAVEAYKKSLEIFWNSNAR
ncbi:MAG: redoxin domain-containing protein [Candidatus Tectomicrobia bacterium]|nr:redoxin domain-containing protein [Candidatus Tectomicrobia bacterium]